MNNPVMYVDPDNKMWSDFGRQNPNPTAQQVLDKVNESTNCIESSL